ncbi:MAG: hypothetical protein RLZZ26_342 [Candidatus Parcubacteria bacterium]|jgi:uncharacterized RDD family membrane protein YckC/type II secretory pathway pseudopilin PulG
MPNENEQPAVGVVESVAPVMPPVSSQVDMPAPIKYAGFWVRAGALVIDSVVMWFAGLALSTVLGSGKSSAVIQTVVSFGYYVLMITYYQATVGKIVVGLHVERTSGERVGLGRAILREVIGKFLSTILLGIGYFMAGWTKKKQGLHDMVADTVVVENEPKKSKKVWVVVGITVAAMLPAIAIIGIISGITLASLNTARTIGSDAAVRSDLAAITTQAEIYFGEHANSYQGYCTSQEALSTLAAASRIGSNDGSSIFYICNDSPSAYAASVPLKTGGYACVDSVGTSEKQMFANLLASGVTSCGTPQGETPQ